MSETAKWQVYGQMGAGWFVGGTAPATPTREEIEGFLCLGPAGAEMAAEFLNSLETSLAEAQKERDDLKEWQAEAKVIFNRNSGWEHAFDDLLARKAAEQQLVEVKAQLDTQAGVIRELREALEKAAGALDGSPVQGTSTCRYCGGTRFRSAHNPERGYKASLVAPNGRPIGPFPHKPSCVISIIVAALSAHVREPETK